MLRLVLLQLVDPVGPTGRAVPVPAEAHLLELGLPLVAEGVLLPLLLVTVQLALLVDPRGEALPFVATDGDVAVSMLILEGLEVRQTVPPTSSWSIDARGSQWNSRASRRSAVRVLCAPRSALAYCVR